MVIWVGFSKLTRIRTDNELVRNGEFAEAYASW